MIVDVERAALGFLGTGTITSAIVTGLCAENASHRRIFVSPRNHGVATRLASSFRQVTVADSNQDVLNRSDIVFLAVRPQIADEVLARLTFRPDHHIISLIATFSGERIASLTGPAESITCAVPQPTVSARLGPTAIYPPDAVAASLFGRLGLAIEVRTETEFRALFASTAAMASYFTVLDALGSWLTRHGISASTAHDYVSMMFSGLGQVPQRSNGSFEELAQEFKTKGGLNEQFATELARDGVFDAFPSALDRILARIDRGANPSGPGAQTRDAPKPGSS